MAKEKKIYSTWILKDIIDIVFEHGGIIKDIAKHLGVSVRYFYEYMDVYPEAKTAQVEALGYLERHKVETAYETVDKIVDMTVEDTSNALKAATTVLTKSKKSMFYEEKKAAEQVIGMTLADQANYSRLQHEEEERNKK